MRRSRPPPQGKEQPMPDPQPDTRTRFAVLPVLHRGRRPRRRRARPAAPGSVPTAAMAVLTLCVLTAIGAGGAQAQTPPPLLEVSTELNGGDRHNGDPGTFIRRIQGTGPSAFAGIADRKD